MDLFQQLVDEGKLTAEEAKALSEGLASKLEGVQKDAMAKANEHIKAEFDKIMETVIAPKDAEIQALKESQGFSEEDVKSALLQLENKLIGELSMYIQELSTETISEELVSKVAKFELYESTFNGIVGLVGGSIASLDPVVAEQVKSSEEKLAQAIEESKALAESLQGELARVKKDLDSMSTSNAKILAENQSLQKGLLILKESDGLTDEEQLKMVEHFKGKTLEETKTGLAEYKKLVESQSVAGLVDNFRRDKDRAKHNRGTGRTVEQPLDESRSIEQVNHSGQVAQEAPQLSEQQQLFNQAGNLID